MHTACAYGRSGESSVDLIDAIASQAELLCERILKNDHGNDEGALGELRGKIAGIRAELKS